MIKRTKHCLKRSLKRNHVEHRAPAKIVFHQTWGSSFHGVSGLPGLGGTRTVETSNSESKAPVQDLKSKCRMEVSTEHDPGNHRQCGAKACEGARAGAQERGGPEGHDKSTCLQSIKCRPTGKRVGTAIKIMK